MKEKDLKRKEELLKEKEKSLQLQASDFKKRRDGVYDKQIELEEKEKMLQRRENELNKREEIAFKETTKRRDREHAKQMELEEKANMLQSKEYELKKREEAASAKEKEFKNNLVMMHAKEYDLPNVNKAEKTAFAKESERKIKGQSLYHNGNESKEKNDRIGMAEEFMIIKEIMAVKDRIIKVPEDYITKQNISLQAMNYIINSKEEELQMLKGNTLDNERHT